MAGIDRSFTAELQLREGGAIQLIWSGGRWAIRTRYEEPAPGRGFATLLLDQTEFAALTEMLSTLRKLAVDRE